jgi:hypothetical protein
MRTTYLVTRARALLRADINTFAEARSYAQGRFNIMGGNNWTDIYVITKRDVLADGDLVHTTMGTIDREGFHIHPEF